jgi:Predicted metal-dependent phosphoesterases (PHP family)
MIRFDAHTHSSISDGTDSPENLVKLADEAGLDVVALTDHDTFIGLERAQKAADSIGIELVPGVELSTTVGGVSLHLLGYYPDTKNTQLLQLLERIRDSRRTRIQKMAENLAADFPGMSWEALDEAGTKDRPWGRPHLADLLVVLGYFPNREAAFAGPLHPRQKYYVRQWSPAPEDMVEVLRGSGGVPVLAHPRSGRRRGVNEETLAKMVDAGLFGLERDHREQDEEARAQVGAWARQYGLAVTGGSDYHGTGKPNRLGENLTTPEVLQQIKNEAGV